jgi:hypothetical protein
MHGFHAVAYSDEELRELLPGAIRSWAAGNSVRGDIHATVHIEKPVKRAALVVRVAQDEFLEHRREVVNRVHRALTVPEQREMIAEKAPESSTGEPVMVAAHPGDTLAWLAQQTVADEHLLVGIAVADEFLMVFGIVNATGGDSGERLGEPELTIADVLPKIRVQSHDRELVTVNVAL